MLTTRYSGIRHRAAPFPLVVQRLRERAEAISGASYNAALLNLYRDDSDSVGWHSDHKAGLGNCPTIASLSLGATRRFQFRHRRTKETITLELSEGVWLVMPARLNDSGFTKCRITTAAVAPRINLTFRRDDDSERTVVGRASRRPRDDPATRSYLDAFAKLEAGDPDAIAAFAAHLGKLPKYRLAKFHLKRLLNGAKGTRIAMD